MATTAAPVASTTTPVVGTLTLVAAPVPLDLVEAIIRVCRCSRSSSLIQQSQLLDITSVSEALYLGSLFRMIISPGLGVGARRRRSIQARLGLIRIPGDLNPFLGQRRVVLSVPLALSHGIGSVVCDLDIGDAVGDRLDGVSVDCDGIASFSLCRSSVDDSRVGGSLLGSFGLSSSSSCCLGIVGCLVILRNRLDLGVL